MKVKAIEYSYPTSPNADRFGFKTGCYTVEIGELPKVKPFKAVAGFKTITEAAAFAATMPEPFSSQSH